VAKDENGAALTMFSGQHGLPEQTRRRKLMANLMKSLLIRHLLIDHRRVYGNPTVQGISDEDSAPGNPTVRGISDEDSAPRSRRMPPSRLFSTQHLKTLFGHSISSSRHGNFANNPFNGLGMKVSRDDLGGLALVNGCPKLYRPSQGIIISAINQTGWVIQGQSLHWWMVEYRARKGNEPEHSCILIGR
jgi:hypothetical protein